MGVNVNDSIFLTQEERELFLLSQIEVDEEESEQQLSLRECNSGSP
jgi:hypothetical protein